MEVLQGLFNFGLMPLGSCWEPWPCCHSQTLRVLGREIRVRKAGLFTSALARSYPHVTLGGQAFSKLGCGLQLCDPRGADLGAPEGLPIVGCREEGQT